MGLECRLKKDDINHMSWVNIQYKSNLKKYEKIDGVKAILLYCLIMCSAFFQGWLYTTNLETFVLETSQIWISVILLAVCFCFIYCSKENIKTLGINTENIWNSLALGLVGGFLLLALQATVSIAQGKSVTFTNIQLFSCVVFVLGAFEEEILFRGYIQTRLSGLINSQWTVGIINSVLFLSMHYPVKWVVFGEVCFDILPAVYIVLLIALHFFCDAVYKRTNCLWGSIMLHTIYNAVGAMIVFQ